MEYVEEVRAVSHLPRGRRVQTTDQKCNKFVKNITIVKFQEKLGNLLIVLFWIMC